MYCSVVITEAAAVAKREAAASNAALVSGPSTPVLAITIGGSMRSSSEITAGSAQVFKCHHLCVHFSNF